MKAELIGDKVRISDPRWECFSLGAYPTSVVIANKELALEVAESINALLRPKLAETIDKGSLGMASSG
jgi:hypothetical protein